VPGHAFAVLAQTSEPDTGTTCQPVLVARLKLANTLYDQDNLAAALVEYRRSRSNRARRRGCSSRPICARLNRPVEAVAEFANCWPRQAAHRSKAGRARRLRDEQRARIGRLMIQTKVPAFIESTTSRGQDRGESFRRRARRTSRNAVPDMRYVMPHPIEVANGPHLVAAWPGPRSPAPADRDRGG